MACRSSQDVTPSSSQDLTPSSSDVSWLVHVHDHDAPFCVGRRAGQISSDKTSQKVDNHRRNIHPSFRHMRPKRSTAGQSLPTRELAALRANPATLPARRPPEDFKCSSRREVECLAFLCRDGVPDLDSQV